MEDVAFIFQDAKADAMVESTHLKNEPWEKTLKQCGKYKKIDYLFSLDSDLASLPYEEARDRLEEISEMKKIFGVR